MKSSLFLILALYHSRCLYVIYANAELVKGLPRQSPVHHVSSEIGSVGKVTNLSKSHPSRIHYASLNTSLPTRARDASVISESQKELTPNPPSTSISVKKVFTITVPLISLVILYKNFYERIPTADALKSQLLVVLERVNNQGIIGIMYYILVFSIYEMFGLSTVPVETISGMAFGFQKGALGSAIGKIIGALLAFTLGRTVLRPTIKSKLNNDLFLSISHSISRHQLKNALFLKFSIFPEIIKNTSMAVMDVKISTFILVTVIHGIPYTLLWNWLGHDSAMRIKSIQTIPPNYMLNSILFGVTLFGIIGSPTLFAFWLRSLQKDAAKGE